MHKNSDKYFRSANFYLSSYLFSKGLTLVNIDHTEPKRAEFVFVDTPEREQLIYQFNFSPHDSPDTLVDARSLITAIKTLKDKLYQER
jgi:hypothetical protein